ncbi:MARVEL domain-containing protein 3 [Microcaecilia unicolor]|uniref:MARVEL domain-containing protein 3 n=1 Tax=Microcaecilia unicolor TaxID=1415580 RepID=A0A6P7YD09_9AMPH|nr:MARVEL domain-containing protein 3 [Microcaecilia unicolor]
MVPVIMAEGEPALMPDQAELSLSAGDSFSESPESVHIQIDPTMSRIPRNRENQDPRDQRHREEGSDHRVRPERLKNGPGTRSVPSQKKEASWSQESRPHHDKSQQYLKEKNDRSRERGRHEGRSQQNGGHRRHYREEQDCDEYYRKKGDLYRDVDRRQGMNPDQCYSSNVKEIHHQESDYYRHERAPPSVGYMPHPPDWSVQELEYHETEREGGILECNKCRYLCTGRGVLQLLEVVLNALVLLCVISSYFVLSGFSSGFGSNNFYSPFEGQELVQVRQLDQQFTVLRAPLLYGGLAFCLVLGALTLGLLAAGSKQFSRKWLLFEAAFSLLACLAYTAAVGVFLHFALQVNSTDVCKRREQLYARNGLTWMNCDLAGTDGAAATFAILLVIFYGISFTLVIRAYREINNYADHPEQEWPSGNFGQQARSNCIQNSRE